MYTVELIFRVLLVCECSTGWYTVVALNGLPSDAHSKAGPMRGQQVVKAYLSQNLRCTILDHCSRKWEPVECHVWAVSKGLLLDHLIELPV